MGNAIVDLMSIEQPLAIDDNLQRYSDGEVYNLAYVNDDENIVCVSAQDRYRWGFSAWFLILATAFHGAWCLLLVVLYCYSLRRSRLCQAGRHLRPLKAIMHLSNVVESHIADHAAMRAEELDKAMKDQGLRYRVVQGKNGAGCTFVEAV